MRARFWPGGVCLAVAGLLLLTRLAAGGESEAQVLWREHIKGKPSPRILDDFEVIPLICFRAIPGISARSAAMADVIRQAGGVQVMQGCQSLQRMASYATYLKGGPLSKTEEGRVKALYDKLVREYQSRRPAVKPNAMQVHATFGLGDVANLHWTIAKCKTVEEAVSEVERLHGFKTVLESGSDIPFERIAKSIHKSIPVLLGSSDGKFVVCFGYSMKDGRPVLFLNDPEQTPLSQGPPIFSRRDLESESPTVRKSIRYAMRDTRITTDYEIDCDRTLAAIGFRNEPFEIGKYKAYFIHHWEFSAEPLKTDILEILKMKEPAAHEAPGKAEGLWDQEIRNRKYTVMGNAKLVPMTIIRSGGFISQLCGSLASVSCGKFGPQIGECGLEPKKFYRAARIMAGGDYEVDLTQEEREALDKLCAEGRKQYETAQVPMQVHVKDCQQPYYRAALQVSATVGNTGNLGLAVEQIARLHGWTSVIEGGKLLPFDKYQEALDKNIPILLQESKSGGWLVSCGYVVREGKPWLLVANPSEVPGSEYQVLNDRDFPKQVLQFEPFEQERYVPYFVYGWERSAGAYAKEISEIMKDHPKPEKPAEKPGEKKE